LGELARRNDYQGPGMGQLVFGIAGLTRELANHEPDGDGFAGARLRRHPQISAGQRRVEHCLLYGRELRETFCGNCSAERGAEQFGEVNRSHIAAAPSTSPARMRRSRTGTGKAAEFSTFPTPLRAATGPEPETRPGPPRTQGVALPDATPRVWLCPMPHPGCGFARCHTLGAGRLSRVDTQGVALPDATPWVRAGLVGSLFVRQFEDYEAAHGIGEGHEHQEGAGEADQLRSDPVHTWHEPTEDAVVQEQRD